MGQYNTKQQSNRICADCDYYERHMFEDSFGPYVAESCNRGQHAHVRQHAEACKYFKDEKYYNVPLSIDDLARDVLAADRAGMSYGQWKALHPNTKWDYEAARMEAELEGRTNR